jgi:hypothetical protein
MNWKRYRNELILLAVTLFAVMAFVYKSSMHNTMALNNQKMAQDVAVLQEITSLKKVWGDKRIPQKLDSVRTMVPASKVQWQKQGKKLTAHFSELQPSKVNKIISKFLNTPVQIERLKVEKKGDVYSVEIKCKW